MNRLMIRNIGQLLTLRGASGRPKTGSSLSDLGIIENGCVAIEGETIAAVGTEQEVWHRLCQRWGERLSDKADVMDAGGRVVMPGMVDPHTHLVFAGTREYELEMRLQGATYLEILQAGGGILATTRKTRQATEEELLRQASSRLDRFLQYGVTTVEAKSGYGLDWKHEWKQLRVARRLHETHPVDVVSTFMGAHVVPEEYRNDPDRYVDIVVDEMIPQVADKGLAEFCDVFCEKDVFSLEQSRRVLEAGKRHGLMPKIHADEMEAMGGAELAADLGAISADHLLRVSDRGICRLAETGVIAVLLPGTAFYLMAPFARARDMIEAGVAVALSTDCNPGSSPTMSMPMILNLACLHMRMTPAEAISAATINAAHAIGRGWQIGSLEEGKQADLVLLDAPHYAFLQYHFGINLIDTVIKKGRVVVKNGQLVRR
ncbi:imidazolonepropionase [Polycladomyces abyssicola]|uniref:Imidazolonepropionase n=2 Tax=Polycladomyces abyssicola TaxID=1125966 RepID=A0A8D5UEQ4_9BACL|nr:imidazolonepropionase [Polycladomyces abyssicola]BCU80692.1 imidazolonepropionase [Polycladomyces abyssicola]